MHVWVKKKTYEKLMHEKELLNDMISPHVYLYRPKMITFLCR
jgi:hypothetical protein